MTDYYSDSSSSEEELELKQPQPQTEPKPKRKYVKKEKTTEELEAIKKKRIEILAKAREAKKLNQNKKKM